MGTDGEAVQDHAPGFFRYAVVRVAGLPIEHLTRLNAPGTTAEADAILRDRARLRAKASILTGLLHDLIPGQTKSVRRRLLRLRRDIHNLRRPNSQDVVACPRVDLRRRLAGFAEELGRWTGRREAFQAIYDAEMAKTRALLYESFRDPDFQAGVRLSSRSLSGCLKQEGAHIPAPSDAKAENGLLRYLTRTAAKATPFGRFCAILPGVLRPAPGAMTFDEDPGCKWSRIRANKRLMHLTLRHFLGDAEARRQLPVRLNPTLAVERRSLRFLSSFDRTEVFQTVSRNAALDVVLDELRRHGAGNVDSLATALSAVPELDAEPEEAESYVDRLFEIGLLQLDLPGLANDPEWPAHLRDLTASMHGDRASEGTALLNDVVARVAAIRENGVKPDDDFLAALEDSIERALDDWNKGGLTLRGPCVYEDAGAQGWARIDSAHFSAALRGLRELVETLVPLGGDSAQRGGLLRLFNARFATDRAPLLDFYEAHAQEARKRAERAKEKTDASPETGANQDTGGGDLASVPHAASDRDPGSGNDGVGGASQALTELIARKWSADVRGREIALRRRDLQATLPRLPGRAEGPQSASLFVNWVPRPGDPSGGQVLVPRALSMLGFGKFFSRFLYLLPSEILQALGQVAVGADTVLAEIAGDQAFNANLRPPIHGAEIVYPNGDRAGCREAFDVGRLEVGLNGRGDRLDLFDRVTGRRVVPLDLGFMNPNLRPPLYQLLRSFSPPSSSTVPLPGRPLSAEGPANEDPKGWILRRPRITYEGHVILARETWFLPAGRLPACGPDESDAAFFMRVREWQAIAGLPDVVYVRVVHSRRAGAGGTIASDADEAESDDSISDDPLDDPDQQRIDGADARTREDSKESEETGKAPSWRGDLHKPQYLDFRSPLLVRLLGRYGALPDDRFLVFEEWLPGSSDLPATAPDRHWVSESIIQLDLDCGPVKGADPPVEHRMAKEVAHV